MDNVFTVDFFRNATDILTAEDSHPQTASPTAALMMINSLDPALFQHMTPAGCAEASLSADHGLLFQATRSHEVGVGACAGETNGDTMNQDSVQEPARESSSPSSADLSAGSVGADAGARDGACACADGAGAGAGADAAGTAPLMPAPAPRLPMSAFYPLHKTDLSCLRMSSHLVVDIVGQPKPEVTKAVYVDLQVRMLDQSGAPVTDFKPALSLVYSEDPREVVKSLSGRETIEGVQTTRDGVCLLKVRINELSKPHRNRLFRVRVYGISASMGAAYADTTPVRVLSKTSIVDQHQRASAMGVSGDASVPCTPVVGMATPMQSRKRLASEASLDAAEACEGAGASSLAVCSHCGEPDSKRAELMNELRALRDMVEMQQAEIAALRRDLCSRLDTVLSLVSSDRAAGRSSS